MENKQTAVEWLIEQLTAMGALQICDGSNAVTNVIEQVKEMEKEQIVDAHDNGYIDGANKKKTTAEQYYNETYGNKS